MASWLASARNAPARRQLVVASLIALLLLLNAIGALNNTITYDEAAHFHSGVNLLAGDSSRFDDSKMPFTALNVLTARALGLGGPTPTGPTLFAARCFTIVFSALLGLLVFTWSRQLYGDAAGVLSLTLYVFSPNVQAHAQLVTTDLFGAGTATLSLYVFWRFCRKDGPRRAATSAFGLGLAQLAKFSAVFLYVIFPLIALVRYVAGDRSGLKRRARAFVIWSLVFLTLSLLVLNAGYLFNGTGASLRDYTFRSELFRAVQEGSGPLAGLPLPLPRPFLEGLDWVRSNERSGEGRGPAYLFGETREGRFPGYYVMTFLFKVPIATQILIVWAAIHYLVNRRRYRFLDDELFLVVPILFYAGYFVLFSNAQMGIRMILVLLPLLHVLCGALLKTAPGPERKKRIALSALAGYLVLSVLSYYPFYVPYFNELVPDRKRAFRILVDSSLDWGQADDHVAQYLRDHPGTSKNPVNPVAGRMVISPNLLTGVIYPGMQIHLPYEDRVDPRPPAQVAWYRFVIENLEPVDQIAYAYLVYDVTPSDLERFGR